MTLKQTFNSYLLELLNPDDLASKNTETQTRLKGETMPGESETKKGLAKGVETAKHSAQAVFTPSKEMLGALVTIFTPSFDAKPADVGEPLSRAKKAIALFGASVVAITLANMPPDTRAALIAKLKGIVGLKADPNEIKAWLNSAGKGGLEPVRKMLNTMCANTVKEIMAAQTTKIMLQSETAIMTQMEQEQEAQKKKEAAQAGAAAKTESEFVKLLGKHLFEEETKPEADPKADSKDDEKPKEQTGSMGKKIGAIAVGEIKNPISKAMTNDLLNRYDAAKKVIKNLGKVGGNLVTFDIYPYEEKAYGHHIVKINTPSNYALRGRSGVTEPLDYSDLSIMVKSVFFQKNKSLLFAEARKGIKESFIRLKSKFGAVLEAEDVKRAHDVDTEETPVDVSDKQAVIDETNLNSIITESDAYAQKNYTLCCGPHFQIMQINGKAIQDSSVEGFMAQLKKAIEDTAKPNPAFAWFNPQMFVKFNEMETNLKKAISSQFNVGIDETGTQDADTSHKGEGTQVLRDMRNNPIVTGALSKYKEEVSVTVMTSDQLRKEFETAPDVLKFLSAPQYNDSAFALIKNIHNASYMVFYTVIKKESNPLTGYVVQNKKIVDTYGTDGKLIQKKAPEQWAIDIAKIGALPVAAKKEETPEKEKPEAPKTEEKPAAEAPKAEEKKPEDKTPPAGPTPPSDDKTKK
jgi:hypothetical protein